jgi:hypothetical protein
MVDADGFDLVVGRAGDELKVLPGISSDSYSGCRDAIASDTSIGRNVGSPRVFAVAAMASDVILLPTGPTVMKASLVGSFSIAAIWSALNCTTVTLSGSTPDSFRITCSSFTLTCVRPTTPMR